MVRLKWLIKTILPTKKELILAVIVEIILIMVIAPRYYPYLNEKYILEKRLGQGAQSKVFLYKTPEGISFAKEHPFVAIKVENYTHVSKEEVYTHRKLNNRYLSTYHTITFDLFKARKVQIMVLSAILSSTWMTFTSKMVLITL